MSRTWAFAAAGALALLLGAPVALRAQAHSLPPKHGETVDAPAVLQRIGFDQRLNAQVPLELVFREETGRQVRLGDYFGSRPVVLSLVYYRCPMLCTLSLNGQLRLFRATAFDIGTQFDVIDVSIDPRETPALAMEKKTAYIAKYNRPGGARGWHFLTGDESSIQALADAVGFRYYYDAAKDEYAHATGLMVLTPKGRIARYQYGVEYSPRDLRLSLVEASAERIGTPVDKVLLYCFRYDPSTGKYSAVVWNLVRAGCIGVFLALVTFVAAAFLRDRRARAASPPEVRT
jgi:protein SCO1/2